LGEDIVGHQRVTTTIVAAYHFVTIDATATTSEQI
jgi:hypothetical protein